MNAETGQAIDLGALIDEGAWTGFQKTVLALAALAFIVDALANQVMAISIPAMMRDWHVTRASFAPVLAVGWVGVAIGTVLAGVLADRVGRKRMLLASILLFGLATISGAFTTGINGLLILRLFDGIGIGGAIPTATTLIAEFTPVRRRSRAVNFGMLAIPMGNLICGLLGSAILPAFGWRALFLINGGVAISVFVMLLLALPESPRFLARFPERDAELRRGLKRLDIAAPAGARWVDGGPTRKTGPLYELFGPDTRAMTLAIWGGFFFCFLAAYSSLNWMPSMLSGLGYNLATTSMALSVAGVGGMAGSLVIAKLVELFGSRTALIVVATSSALGALTLTQLRLDPAASVIPLMAALAWMSLSLNAMTGCIYALAAYMYPSAVRGTGMGAAGAIGRVGAIASSFAAVAAMGIDGAAYFGLIGGAAVVAALCLITIRRQIPSDQGFVRGAAVIR